MKIYQHRCNTLEALRSTPKLHGVEIDVRTYGSRLVVAHDPFSDAITFHELLNSYEHSGIIINVKEEGLETSIIDELATRKINDFVFLDQSFPFMVKSLRQGLAAHIACRVSDLESTETFIRLDPTPRYLWCDSFEGDWHYLSNLPNLLTDRFVTPIIVSPELHGRNSQEETERLRFLLKAFPDTTSVCTKLPEIWS